MSSHAVVDLPLKNRKNIPQYPEINFDKISNNIHKNYIRFTIMLQGFQKCIA